MKYFRLENSTSLKEIGTYPQCNNGKFVSTWNSEHSLLPVFKEKITDSRIEVPEFVLNGRANQTDLISASFVSFKLVISNMLKDLIDANHYEGIQFFKTALHCRDGTIMNYWILNPFGFMNEYIDFSQSIIKCRPPQPESISFLKVADRDGYNCLYENGKKERRIYIIDEPKLYTDKINEEFFLLEGVAGGIGYYVSETLKNEITEAGCTGIAFSEI